MRAALLLLAAAAAAAPAPAPPAAAPARALPPPVLLLLPAACGAGPAAFDANRLRARAADTATTMPTLTILPYRETCKPGWSAESARRALAALAAGGHVAAAGWPGERACAALRGAARALRRPLPAACAAAAARGAALAELAARLRWRRALLPPPAAPAATAAGCDEALREAAAALAAAGLAVRRDTSAELELDPLPRDHVVVMCAADGSVRALPGTTVLLLRPATSPVPTGNAHSKSNITLDLVKSPYDYLLDNDGFVLSGANLSSDHAQLNKKSFYPLATTVVNAAPPAAADVNTAITSEWENSPRLVTAMLPDNSTTTFFQNNFTEGSSRTAIDPLLRVLLLSDEPLAASAASVTPPTIDEAYDLTLDALRQLADANSSGIEKIHTTFHLYEVTANGGWTRVVELAVRAVRPVGAPAADWNCSVAAVDAAAFQRWSEARAVRADPAGGGGGGWAAGAGAAAACAALVALAAAARVAWRQRRGGRRRADVVLAAHDFWFPPDEHEQRRVGEGMETMLSCWLSHLHEFGGPELERPDLLKQPPAQPPSVPSSTPSVNRAAGELRPRYKGDAVHLKRLPAAPALELRRKATDVLLVMQSLRHENLNSFIGCVCEVRPALVFDHCGRGSLEDVLVADDIKLDWTFRLSLLTDLVRGLRYLHSSTLRVHGHLTSRNCVVDSRWVLRLSDFGMSEFRRAQALPPPHRSARDLLWTAPELLREWREGREARGSQPGDVFSFAIIMQEVIVRGEPYCMLALTPEEIVEKLCRPPPLIRPSVSMGAAPPEAVSVMRQCWAEAPDLRPDTHALNDIFRHLHRGRKINIVDSMFEMLEKYSNNLEELIKDRTEQLDMEKKKTEQLLNRMLPSSVAERLLAGQRVPPEEFAEVSIYFSDIVGFTGLAARSTPVQVVDLLNDLYTTFDAAIEQYRVYKVETIGDAYMVVGGLPVRRRDHAESVATMALHLLHLAGRFRLRHLPATPLHLRIGLHSGACCAGVVGLTMPRYCLFGDTVNTASRMESTGAAWRIQVSAATADRLLAAGGFRLRSRGLTQIKGKGAMHTYWLLGKDGFDKPLPTPPPLPTEDVLFEADGECEDLLPAAVLSGSPPPRAPAASPGPSPVRLRPGSASPPPHRYEKYAWQRSGAVSADSSPPRLAGAAGGAYSRYRCLGGARALRRQWSLERGEALAAAAGSAGAPAAPAAAPAPAAPAAAAEPLALLAAAAGARPPRYRTRQPPPDAPF